MDREATTADVQPVDVAELAATLQVVINRLARQLRTERTEGLTFTAMAALATVVRHGPLPISELAGIERVKAPSMTRTVGILESMGLVVRRTAEADARMVMVSATEAGIETIERIRLARREWLSARLGQLSAEELSTLRAAAAVLTKVVEL